MKTQPQPRRQSHLPHPTVILLLAALAACAQEQRTSNGSGHITALGMLDLGINTPVASMASGIGSQAINLAGLNVAFGSPIHSIIDDVNSNTRVINARIPVTNRGNTTINNLTLVALSQNGQSLGGTALKQIFNAASPTPASLSDGNIAQDVKPGHAVTTDFVLDNNNADLQAFESSEIAALQSSARSQGRIGMSDTLLQYGFVVRNGSKRALAAGESGTVTISMRVPKSDAAFEPNRFVMSFLAIDEDQTRVTRSLDETPANAIARAAAISDKSNSVKMVMIGDNDTANCGFSCSTVSLARVETATGGSDAAKNAIWGSRVTYGGGTGNERFNTVMVLSDNTILVGGKTNDFAWTGSPSSLSGPNTTLNGSTCSGTSSAGLLMRLASDGKTVLASYSVPGVRDIFRIKSSNKPGQSTGNIYISGSCEGGSEGFYIAKLNTNFVGGPPSGLAWIRYVGAGGDHKDATESTGLGGQVWDVGGDGKVVYALGTPIDVNWAAIQRLKSDGTDDIVPNWRSHWGASGEYDGLLADYPGGAINASYSGLVMKAQRKGSLRSTTAADYGLIQADGNGGTRQGKYPDDYYHKGHCDFLAASTDPLNCNTVNGPGYTGYKTNSGTAKPTQRVGGIAINRDTNDVYIGYGTQSLLPDGNPDFEPAVVGFAADGTLKWWSRLYSETTANSSPDQYIDGLAIDYNGSNLVVLARSHGNNTQNLWSTTGAFKQSFSGTMGNIHISWLGKLGLADGAFKRSTWLAEYNEGETNIPTNQPSSDPNLDGWPSPNAGWVDLNTTRAFDLAVDAQGQVYVVAVGRRTVTTRNAFQKMLKPVTSNTNINKSSWNGFVRVYSSDFTKAIYSSIFTGAWNPTTQAGGDNVRMRGVFPMDGGVVAVGYSQLDGVGNTKGNPMPTTNIPSWGRKAPEKEDAVIGVLKFQ
jgi:hypothetical protein